MKSYNITIPCYLTFKDFQFLYDIKKHYLLQIAGVSSSKSLIITNSSKPQK